MVMMGESFFLSAELVLRRAELARIIWVKHTTYISPTATFENVLCPCTFAQALAHGYCQHVLRGGPQTSCTLFALYRLYRRATCSLLTCCSHPTNLPTTRTKAIVQHLQLPNTCGAFLLCAARAIVVGGNFQFRGEEKTLEVDLSMSVLALKQQLEVSNMGTAQVISVTVGFCMVWRSKAWRP